MGNRILDLDALATDIDDLIHDHAHPFPGHIGDDEIRGALPVFLAALGLNIHGQPIDTTPPAGNGHTSWRTQHTCPSGAAGGHLTPNCPRCDELAAGAPPYEAPEWVHRLYQARAAGNTAYANEIKGHFGRGGRHKTHCAETCTFVWS